MPPAAGPATEITNLRAGPVVRAARLRKRALRQQAGLFLAEGPQAVREALAASGGTVAEVFATAEAAKRHPDLVRLADADADVLWHRASGSVVAHLSDTVTPQGIVAVCRSAEVAPEAAVPPDATLVTVLAHVRDPGNAGTVIRVSDAAGADGVVVTTASVDATNPKCVRSSAGSLFHLPVAEGVRPEAAIARARALGLQVWAAEGATGTSLDAIGEDDLARPTAWVFGNEAWGLAPEVLELCDRAVAVPMYGAAESLNLSTAAAVCLYASARAQRRRAASGLASGAPTG